MAHATRKLIRLFPAVWRKALLSMKGIWNHTSPVHPGPRRLYSRGYYHENADTHSQLLHTCYVMIVDLSIVKIYGFNNEKVLDGRCFIYYIIDY